MDMKHLIHQHFTLTQIRLKQAAESTDGDPVFEGVIYELGKSLNPSVFAESTFDSGEKVFLGAYMFADHPTAMEEWQRPERSVNDIVGRVVATKRGEAPNGKKALMGEFMISAAHPEIATKVKEGLITGLSINAYVNATFDEELGAWIIESFADPETDNVMPPSVDFVTYPAAGGSIAARESYRQDLLAVYQEGKTPPMLTQFSATPPTPAQDDNAATLLAEVKALRLSLERREATEGIAEQVRATLSNVQPPTVARIMSATNAHIQAYRDGTLETLEALKAAIETTVQTERDYAAQLVKSGVPNGMSFSWSQTQSNTAPADSEDLAAIDQWFKRAPAEYR